MNTKNNINPGSNIDVHSDHKKSHYVITNILMVVLLFAIIACSPLKVITFDTYIDTSNKKIVYQSKQDFKVDATTSTYLSNNMDGARLNGFYKKNDSTISVIINPENTPINNSSYFAFKTWADGETVWYFDFKYPKGYKHRYIPKIGTPDHWYTLDSTNIKKNDSICVIKIKLNKSPIIIAAQEVHSSSKVRQWYTHLAIGKPEVKIKSVGQSTLGRNLPVLDIYYNSPKNKDIIVLLTRQHPPEVTGYFAFQYFLEKILETNTPYAKEFFSKYRILAFPIMNPDGVDLGHWRHNANGIDLNRDWSRYKQKEIKNVVKFINKQVTNSKAKLVLGIDFHSTWYDVMYTNKERERTHLPFFLDQWFNALQKKYPEYIVNEQPGVSKKPVSKGWFLKMHKATGLTYEIGDDTPRSEIKKVARVLAEEMMKILSTKNKHL